MAINAKVDNTTYEGIEKITAGGKTVELSEVYSGSQSITANGTYDIGGKAEVVVNVPTESAGGNEPTGSINITTNGTHNVADYAQAVVNVPQEGYDVDDIVGGGGTAGSNAIFYKAANVETNVSVIRHYAFAGLSMNKVTAPNLTAIGDNSFMSCGSLTEVDAPNTTKIGNAAFNYCGSLTKAYYPSVTSVGNKGVFQGCAKLTDVNFDSLTALGESMFSGCKGLITISLPAVTKANYNEQFCNCTSLQSVNVPLLANTSQNMFKNCTSLEEIVLPAVTGVGIAMFEGCTALKKVDFGEGVTAVGNGQFKNCTALETVILRYNGVATNSNKAFNSCVNGVTVYVPSAQLEAYRANSQWTADTNVTFAAIEGSEYE